MIRQRAIIIAHAQQQQRWWYTVRCSSSSDTITIIASQYHHHQQQQQQKSYPMMKQQRMKYHYYTHIQQFHNSNSSNNNNRYNNRSILQYSTNRPLFCSNNNRTRNICIPFHSMIHTIPPFYTTISNSSSTKKMLYHHCSTVLNNSNNHNDNNSQQQQQNQEGGISSNNNDTNTNSTTILPVQQYHHHRRVWKAQKPIDDTTNPTTTTSIVDTNHSDSNKNKNTTYWTNRVIDQRSNNTNRPIEELIQQISTQSDVLGGKLPPKQLGVLHQDPVKDMQMLIENYTVKAVASALRDREDALQYAATLASDPNKIQELITFLQIFHPKYVLERRQQQKVIKRHINIFNPNDDNNTNTTTTSNTTTTTTNDPVTALHLDASRQLLRKALMRMPRTITTAHSKRAGICIPLCLCNNIPSILFEKRSSHLKNHPNEICFPGGMVCDIQDQTIVSTSIREMKEEIGGLDGTTKHNSSTNDDDPNSNNDTVPSPPIEVIGILRLNWGEVHHLTGVAVTPVVCYLGELPDKLYPNPEEVSEVFTIPLIDLLNKSYWIHQDSLAPIFIGGPYVIWGLTGYILERFAIELGRLST
jgi:nudix motif 8